MSETIDNDCDKCGYYGSECVCPPPEAIEALKQENVRLRDALMFYADIENHKPQFHHYEHHCDNCAEQEVKEIPIFLDMGQKAREALKTGGQIA